MIIPERGLPLTRTIRTWLKSVASRRSGYVAENYFLEAMNRLGYVVVTKTNPRLGDTIRKTPWWEESRCDFVVTRRYDTHVMVIPLELTLMENLGRRWNRRWNKRFQRKVQRANEGLIALVAPGSDFSSKALFELLECAAHGERNALVDLKARLETIFSNYLELSRQV